MAPRGNVVSLYDSYIKALRWASDRIGESGIIGFVTPSAWITGEAQAGVRACITNEFTDVWCFDLRGDVKKADWRKEGDKIFGSGSTVGIAITVLVKNPKKEGCTIHYKDVGDYLTREQKLRAVSDGKSVAGLDWRIITPRQAPRLADQRGELDAEWASMTTMGSREGKRGKTGSVIFGTYSRGLATSRDDWAYNTSKDELEKNMRRHINYCNEQDLDNFVINPKLAKKNSSMIERMKKLGNKVCFDRNKIRTALHRPFFKQYLYFDPVFVHEPTIVPPFFPHGDSENPAILVQTRLANSLHSWQT